MNKNVDVAVVGGKKRCYHTRIGTQTRPDGDSPGKYLSPATRMAKHTPTLSLLTSFAGLSNCLGKRNVLRVFKAKFYWFSRFSG